ncbi:nitronate monooxygenase [Aspergillus udagawae]|uniref:Nitronate monooxygenase n=1 Tax=Aspergillus udagawae TaxID=91492 RepID=A0ABQ1BB04_9EURO|nr:nitronate monooxygenase [Aspergillus udagawae]GFF34829.1 nitronate monooxygenase [Aspergillus udagawae]GFF97638.1 nitronate monooxygenase [Aspergillus udagawae]
MALSTILRKHLPWMESPFIINAPMSGAAASDLAIAVTRAGGLGQIGFMDNRQMLSEHLKKAQHGLQDMMKSLPNPNILPIGVGIIVFGSPVDDWMSLFSLYKPAVVWLSFASTPEFTSWTRGIRRATPETKVWIQLGSVTAAVEVAEACRPDALVIQGSDAGGHGHQDGASIVSLIPEVADALRERTIYDIPLIAAGGIADGRGCAAALALGASGVVMGTRFLAARETRVPDIYRDAILHASDGASTTARSRIFDDIWGPNFWPMAYDGRCLRNKVYEDYRNGVGVDRIRTWLYAGARQDGSEPLEPKDTGSIWAGTGVGLVKKVEGAADIVQEVRDDARARLSTAFSSL